VHTHTHTHTHTHRHTHAGTLNYETLYHTTRLLGIWYTRIIKLYIKQVHG